MVINDSNRVDSEDHADDIRSRILIAAADLIASKGRDAATTRAVAMAASVQAPAIYRLFGDKNGLINATAEYCLTKYIAEKATYDVHLDPIEALRMGWDNHVRFGLTYPDLFKIISCQLQSNTLSTAMAAGMNVLREKIKRVALAGCLVVSEERAVALMHSACVGTVLTLLSVPEKQRDMTLSELSREAVLTAIIIGESEPTSLKPSSAAIRLKAMLDQTSILTPGEHLLLQELLDRIANE